MGKMRNEKIFMGAEAGNSSCIVQLGHGKYMYVFAKPYIRGIATNIGKL